MFGRQKRNKQEFTQPPTPETHEALQSELAAVISEIETRKENIAQSFRERMSGEKHDGEHNRFADEQLTRIEALEVKRNELEAEIDNVGSAMARIALNDKTK